MITPNDRAIEVISYLQQVALKRVSVEHGYSFRQESYTRWAAKEILIRLQKNKDLPPLMVVETFRDEMDEYSCAGPEENSYRFSVAKDTAEWVIDLLID